MYEFATGPLVWIAFLVFVLGSIYKLASMAKLAKKDKVVYPYVNVKFGLRSLLHWVIPFGSRNMRLRPFMTIFSSFFHIFMLITPLFVLGHIALWKEAWGFGWPHLPEFLANAAAIAVIVFGIIFALRRLLDPTVRFVTKWSDWLILLLVLSPFISGVIAYYQFFDYETTVIVHIFSGALWLMAIPFTRLAHMLFFFFTRTYMGAEFGYVRHSKDW